MRAQCGMVLKLVGEVLCRCSEAEQDHQHKQCRHQQLVIIPFPADLWPDGIVDSRFHNFNPLDCPTALWFSVMFSPSFTRDTCAYIAASIGMTAISSERVFAKS